METLSYFPDAPIAVESQAVRVGAALNHSTVLEVVTCANPAVDTYKWQFNGEDLRPGIEGATTGSINITRVTMDDFGNYTCTVTNTVNGTQQRHTDITMELFAQSEYSCGSV